MNQKKKQRKQTNRPAQAEATTSNNQFPVWVQADITEAMIRPAWTGDTKAYIAMLHQCLKDAPAVLIARAKERLT